MKHAYGGQQRARVVTLDGNVIDTSGTMSGGGNKVALSLFLSFSLSLSLSLSHSLTHTHTIRPAPSLAAAKGRACVRR